MKATITVLLLIKAWAVVTLLLACGAPPEQDDTEERRAAFMLTCESDAQCGPLECGHFASDFSPKRCTQPCEYDTDCENLQSELGSVVCSSLEKVCYINCGQEGIDKDRCPSDMPWCVRRLSALKWACTEDCGDEQFCF